MNAYLMMLVYVHSTFGPILRAKPRQDAAQALQTIESLDRL